MIDPTGLLMIEPKLNIQEPVNDEYTFLALVAMQEARHIGGPGKYWRGSHGCKCGRPSDNSNWYVRGMETNSLLVHYVRDHRVEVPEEELKKLEQFREEATSFEPTKAFLHTVADTARYRKLFAEEGRCLHCGSAGWSRGETVKLDGALCSNCMRITGLDVNNMR